MSQLEAQVSANPCSKPPAEHVYDSWFGIIKVVHANYYTKTRV